MMRDVKVNLMEDWQTGGWRILIRGRGGPGEPYSYLREDGRWETVEEGAGFADGAAMGVLVPEGALEEIVRQFLKVKEPQQATQDHLKDAIGVRDRLLAMVERTVKES